MLVDELANATGCTIDVCDEREATLRGAGFVPTGRQTAAEPLGDGTFADLHELELLR